MARYFSLVHAIPLCRYAIILMVPAPHGNCWADYDRNTDGSNTKIALGCQKMGYITRTIEHKVGGCVYVLIDVSICV